MIAVERKQFLRLIDSAARFALSSKYDEVPYKVVYLTYNGGYLKVESFGEGLKYTGEMPIWGDAGDERPFIGPNSWCAAVDPKPLIAFLKQSGKGNWGGYDTIIKYQGSDLCIEASGAHIEFLNWLGDDMPPQFTLPENRGQGRLRSVYFNFKSLDIASNINPNTRPYTVNNITANVMVDLQRQLLISTDGNMLYSSPIQLLGNDPVTINKAILINKKMLGNIVKSIPTDMKSEVLLNVSLNDDRPSLSFHVPPYSYIEALGGQYEEIPQEIWSMLATNNDEVKYPVYINTGDLVSACKQISALKANIMFRRTSTNIMNFISISDDNNINVSLATRTKNDIPHGVDDVVLNPNYILTMLKHSLNSGESAIYFAKENASRSPIGIYSGNEALNGFIMPMRY